MKVPELLYGSYTSYGMTNRRFGSARIGAVLCTIDCGSFSRAYMAELGRLGVSYGPAGGIEAGLVEIPDAMKRWERFIAMPRGRAIGLYWADRSAPDATAPTN